MKKLFFVALVAITSIAFFSCKKDKSSSSSLSHWTVKDTTYNSDFGVFTVKILQASDASGNSIAIYFNEKPTAGGTFAVRAISPSSPNQCSIIIEKSSETYYSTNGGDATVTVSSTGKVTVSFTGITVTGFDSGDITTASGTVVEN